MLSFAYITGRAEQVLKTWDESRHPRVQVGTAEGGQFTAGSGGPSGHRRRALAWGRAYNAARGRGLSHGEAARHANQRTNITSEEDWKGDHTTGPTNADIRYMSDNPTDSVLEDFKRHFGITPNVNWHSVNDIPARLRRFSG